MGQVHPIALLFIRIQGRIVLGEPIVHTSREMRPDVPSVPVLSQRQIITGNEGYPFLAFDEDTHEARSVTGSMPDNNARSDSIIAVNLSEAPRIGPPFRNNTCSWCIIVMVMVRKREIGIVHLLFLH